MIHLVITILLFFLAPFFQVQLGIGKFSPAESYDTVPPNSSL